MIDDLKVKVLKCSVQRMQCRVQFSGTLMYGKNWMGDGDIKVKLVQGGAVE